MTTSLVLALGLLAMAGFQSANGDIFIEFIRNSRLSRRNEVGSRPRSSLPPPPPVTDLARFARYIVHYSEWTSLGHISHQEVTAWYPQSRVFSVSDGPVGNSTGIPYIYTSLLDATPRDLDKDPRCSMTMSLAQTDFCSSRHLDPENPRCGQVILTGSFVKVENNTDEWRFAENALFSRHPEMKTWPKGHNFFFGKLEISHVQILDTFGGSKFPNVSDYFNSPPPMRSSHVFPQISEELEDIDNYVNENGLDNFRVDMMN